MNANQHYLRISEEDSEEEATDAELKSLSQSVAVFAGMLLASITFWVWLLI